MARQRGARKVEVEASGEEREPEPRAPQAYSTGEYSFFRGGDAPHAGAASVTGVHLPLSSGGWLVPLIGVAVIATLTFFLLQ